MSFRFSPSGILPLLLLVLATGASAQKTQSTPPLNVPLLPTQAPSDSSLIAQGGLLITVTGEDKSPLDRQALVKATNKDTQNVIWQTTGRNSEANLGALRPGAYELEVSAVGYLTSTLNTKLPAGNLFYRVPVALQKDPSAVELNSSNQQLLPAKARKEINGGVADLKSGKLKQARKHLDAADQMVPNNPDVKFLLGYLSFQEKDFKQAESDLVSASTLDPHNIQTLTLLGRLQIQQQNYEAAR